MKIVSRACADQRGFTLAELLVAVAILGLIMMGVLTLIMTGNQTYVTGSNQIEAQQAARAALERMVREIRGAGYNPTGAACPPVINCPIVGFPGFGNATATALVIQNDNNGNGVFVDWDPVANTAERVVYRLNGTNLERQAIGIDATPQTIIGRIPAGGLTFTYLDKNGATLAVPANPLDIRSVQILLTTQPENQPATWQAGRVLVTMSDRIRFRNPVCNPALVCNP